LYGDATVNNLLELLAIVITIWLQLVEDPDTENCIMALGDNTSALGWIYRSSHIDVTSLYFETTNVIARKLSQLVTNSRSCLASQYVKGHHNTVANLLSFTTQTRGTKIHPLASNNLPDDILTQCFLRQLPQRVPKDFAILPLPRHVLSFATQVLVLVESSWI
jgi:hypothetical protein